MSKYEVHPVTLTPEERADRALRTSSLIEEVAKMEESAKLASKMAKEDIDAKRAELRAFSRAAHTGIEERSIEVDHRPNNDRFTIETIGVDTGEVVATRPMREDELRAAKQTLLPLRDITPGQVVPIREGSDGRLAKRDGGRP